MERLPDPDTRAAVLAQDQDGLLTPQDAEACGLTYEQVKGRLESGRWCLEVRGVYRMAGAPRTRRQRIRAAQLAVAGAGGVASHVSAGALHRLMEPSALPHVTVPPTRSARCPIARVHRAELHPADLATVDGIRTTSVSRFLVDMAAVLDRASLEALVDDAICGGKASVSSILRALDRAGGHRRGRTLLRSVLAVWTEAIEPGSPAEVRLLRRLVEWGLSSPVTQHEVFGPDGSFVARVDAAWPDRLVALEYDGVRHHGARRIGADEGRIERLRALGWRVATADKYDLLPGNRHLAALLDRWLQGATAA